MKNIIRAWLKAGQTDLEDALLLFRNKSYKNCALHCHQAIEKLLKAVIIQRGVKLTRTHDLISLLNDAKLKLPEGIIAFIDRINPHYLPAKYPDITFNFRYSKAEVGRILNETKEVFKWLRLELSRQ